LHRNLNKRQAIENDSKLGRKYLSQNERKVWKMFEIICGDFIVSKLKFLAALKTRNR